MSSAKSRAEVSGQVTVTTVQVTAAQGDGDHGAGEHGPGSFWDWMCAQRGLCRGINPEG